MNKSYILTSPFAGQTYPRDVEQAINYFDQALNTSPKPAKLPSHHPEILIVPHIDFRVNLSTYGTGYRRLTERKTFPETFIILGVGHHCPHEMASVPYSYKTILGDVECHSDAWETLKKETSFPIERAPESFESEHSIDFVIIWLQMLHKVRGEKKPFRIIPILMGGLMEAILHEKQPDPESEFTQFTEAFKAMINALDPATTCIIASIDGCHVGPRFQHQFPADDHVQSIVRKWETELWGKCRSDQFDDYFKHLSTIGNGFYFDGVGVMSLLLKTFDIRAHIDATELWHEKRDESFVTFSTGCCIDLK